MSRDAVARDPDLTHVMYVVDAQCYAVDDLEGSCAYAADIPGGKPAAVLEQGALVPDGLSPEAVEAAHRPGQRSRSSRRRILPVTVFGSSSRRTTERGYL